LLLGGVRIHDDKHGGLPGRAREPRVYGKPPGCSKWMRWYSRLGALVTKESARHYEEGQTGARSDECLPEVNCCKGLCQSAKTRR